MGMNRFNAIEQSAKWSLDVIKESERRLDRLKEKPSGNKRKIEKLEKYISQCERAYESKLKTIKTEKRLFEKNNKIRKSSLHSEANG